MSRQVSPSARHIGAERQSSTSPRRTRPGHRTLYSLCLNSPSVIGDPSPRVSVGSLVSTRSAGDALGVEPVRDLGVLGVRPVGDHHDDQGAAQVVVLAVQVLDQPDDPRVGQAVQPR